MPAAARAPLLALLFTLLLPSGAGAAMEAPDALVKRVTLETVQLIRSDPDLRAGRSDKLMALIDRKVLPHFDFRAMAALAMGPSWRKATPEQRERVTQAFRTLLVRTYASALAAFDQEKFEFRPLHMRPEDTDVTVSVRVVKEGAEPVSIDYAMEKTGDGWKVYDVAVGGVSLVASYRTEFNNVVRQSGVDGLIARLEAKNKSLSEAAK